MKDKVVDFDTHLKILNFLIHLEGKGLMNKSQMNYYSMYIQEYLKERNDNIEFMKNLMDELK